MKHCRRCSLYFILKFKIFLHHTNGFSSVYATVGSYFMLSCFEYSYRRMPTTFSTASSQSFYLTLVLDFFLLLLLYLVLNRSPFVQH